jgi:hypothetical protein
VGAPGRKSAERQFAGRNVLGLIFSMTSAFPAHARFGLGALLGL